MKNPRILIAEDDAGLRSMLCLALETRGWDVVAAEDGARALELFKSSQFDLVSTDLDMPNLNGLGLAKAILESSPQTIVMMFSGNVQGEELFKAVGGHAFHPKADPIGYIRTLLALRSVFTKEAT